VILNALENLSVREKKILKRELKKKESMTGLRKSIESIWMTLPDYPEREIRKDVTTAVREVRSRGTI